MAIYLGIAVLVFGDDVPLGVVLLLIAAVLLFHLLYAPLLLGRAGSHAGQTLGKQIMALSVRRSDGDVVDFRTALRRELLGRSLLGLVPFYTLVDLLWPRRTAPPGDTRPDRRHGGGTGVKSSRMAQLRTAERVGRGDSCMT